MVDVWQRSGWSCFTAEEVRAALAAGGDPNVRLYNIRNTILHDVVCSAEPSTEAVRLLIGAGAELEAVNELGESPLWCAVRRGHREAVEALLAAGADPWRPIHGGRSAGRVALDGPLADLFAGLEGAPVVSEGERALQAEADALIKWYSWDRPRLGAEFPGMGAMLEMICIAFMGGVGEEEAIRRMGADPDACPLLRLAVYQASLYPSHGGVLEDPCLWVGSPPSGGLVIYQGNGVLPVLSDFCQTLTGAGGLLASTFDDDDGTVWIWRDGTKFGWPSPFHDPWREGSPEEAWRCRFGDHSHDSGPLARGLALMTLLTSVHVEPEWLGGAPKRTVLVPHHR